MPDCKEYTLRIALTEEEWAVFDKYVSDTGVIKYRFVRNAILDKLKNLGYLHDQKEESK